MSTLSRNIKTILASSMLALSAGTVSDAFAGAPFQVNPNSIPGVTLGSAFIADFINGSSSARVVANGGNVYTSNGYIQYTGFTYLGGAVGVAATRLNLDYGLFATFTQTFNCPAPLAVGVTCGVSTISLNLYADPGFADTFVGAAIGSDPVHTDVGGNDVLLATANVVINGLAGINALGGAFENVNTNFTLQNPAGGNYFINPVPFYTLAFSEFNNTSLGIACSPANCTNIIEVAINSESGGSDLVPIPEPATLALLGMGVLAAGLSRRRKV
jgi:hypothetical protein